MKKAVFTMMIVFVFAFTGCAAEADNDTASNAGIQMAYDMSLEARAFTDEVLKEMLTQKGIAAYSIEQTSGGFITDDPIIYIVGYRYTYNAVTETYGYKISQTKDEFSILEEGTEIGEFIVGNDD